ncbi:hypothetical protein MMC25_007890 [Agyrium rufum]|nr:hypothetical protein [Agyrium rufum]
MSTLRSNSLLRLRHSRPSTLFSFTTAKSSSSNIPLRRTLVSLPQSQRITHRQQCVRASPNNAPAKSQPFSTSSRTLASHESHYEPPSGWLFGVPPGEKYKKEGWEGIWVYGFWGSLLVLGVGGWVFKEDTSIQTWALEEARRRLEKEGILEDPNPISSVSSSISSSAVASSASDNVSSAASTVKAKAQDLEETISEKMPSSTSELVESVKKADD